MIEVEGLPEGYRAIKVVLTNKADKLSPVCATVYIEKNQPRRIVLEDTGEVRKPEIGEYIQNNGNFCKCHKPERWGYEHQIWREVKETDLSLTNDEPKLSLSVDDCQTLMWILKGFNVSELSVRIHEFIKEHS